MGKNKLYEKGKWTTISQNLSHKTYKGNVYSTFFFPPKYCQFWYSEFRGMLWDWVSSQDFPKSCIQQNSYFWKQGNEVLINIAAILQDLHKLFVVLLRLYLSADCCARWQEGLAGANLWVWADVMYRHRWSLVGLWISGCKRDARCLISSGHHCCPSKVNLLSFELLAVKG